MLCQIQATQSNLLTFRNYPINQNRTHTIKIKNISTVPFMKARNSLVIHCRENRANWEKTKEGENILFKALANIFRLTAKLISHVKEEQGCLWPIFYQINFTKR